MMNNRVGIFGKEEEIVVQISGDALGTDVAEAIRKGIDDMWEAYETGVGVASVVLYPPVEHLVRDLTAEDVNKVFEIVKLSNEEDTYCKWCDEEPCAFTTHKDSLLLLKKTALAAVNAKDEVPMNNLSRKALYRQMILIINRRLLGKGVRKPLPRFFARKG